MAMLPCWTGWLTGRNLLWDARVPQLLQGAWRLALYPIANGK